MGKPEMEFTDTELIPWRPIEGSPGAYEKILSMDPATGSYTRILMSSPDLHAYVGNPGFHPGKTLVHDDFFEENFILRGTLIDTIHNKTYRAGFYACRPPGMKHGPFFHPTGAMTLEIRTKI
jgi:hypothetical protein